MTKGKLSIVAFSLLFLATSFLHAQIPDWYISLRKVEPRITSKGEIEQIFANPTVNKSFVDRGIESVYYNTTGGRLTVEYAAGSCPTNRVEECNFTPGTVLGAVFFPNSQVAFSKLKLRTKGMDVFREDDNPTQHYANIKAGLDHSVQRGRILSVRVFHPSMYPKVKQFAKYGDY
jgi:hypothetical protein